MRPLTRLVLGLAAVSTALAVTVAPATAAGSYKVTADASKASINLGQSVTISGKVSGGPVKGKKVTLYWFSAAIDDAPMHKIGTAKLSSKGRYSASFKPKAAGPTFVRVVKGAGSGKAKGSMVTDAFDVWQWQDLSAYESGTSATYGDASVGGKLYRGALLVKQGTLSVFETSTGSCKQVRGRAGVDGGSPATYGQLGVSDAIFSFFAIVSVAKSSSGRSISFSLDPARDLSFGAEFPAANADNTMVLLDGQALCNRPLWRGPPAPRGGDTATCPRRAR